jgi:hypothetical protein
MMKKTPILTTIKNNLRVSILGPGLAAMMIFTQHNAMGSLSTVDLGTDSSFAVLAGSGITVTGPTTITGDIGTAPTPAITGLGNVTLNGVNQGNNAVAQLAQNDLTTAFNDAAGRPANTSYAGGFDLAGLTLVSGVYNDSSSLFLSGTLTLDAQGNPNAVWIIQAGSTLITASNSKVNLIGGAQACHVFWEVGSSATLGTYTDFNGNILALTSITAGTGAIIDGRLLAETGAVTLDNNTITEANCSTLMSPVPEAATVFAAMVLLIPLGVTTLRTWRKQRAVSH